MSARGKATVASPTVAQVVAALFADSTQPVLDELERYGRDPDHNEPGRVQLAILKLSKGDFDALRKLTDHAFIDYRDLLYWAESPRVANLGFGAAPDALKRAKLEDRKELNEWLEAMAGVPVKRT
jgi:hypothetical protein